MAHKNSEYVISTRMLLYLLIVWSLIVSATLVWQAYTYRGLFAGIAEWQFRHLDQMFPVATIVLITALLQIPFLVLIGLRLRQRRRKFGRSRLDVVVHRERLAGRIAGMLAALAGVVAIALIAVGFTIGGIGDKATTAISLRDGTSYADQPVRARGVVRLDRVGFYHERLLITGRELWVAPIAASSDDRTIRYFLEVPQTQQAAPAETREVTGIVRRAAVPGGLRQLYQNAGYSVADPAYVIFASRVSARWPFFSAAADLLLAGLIGLVLMLLLRRHAKKLVSRGDEPESSQSN